MKRIFIIFLISIWPMLSYSQTELTLPFLPNVYQSTYVNPSAVPEHKVSIGLPGLSSVYFGVANTGFAYKDLEAEKGLLDMNLMITELRKKNFLYGGASADLFSLRIKARKYFFSFHIAEKVSARFSYPKDLLSLVVKGNAQFAGSEADFSSLGLDAMHYREYGIQMVKEGRKWTWGGRFKYLNGMSNVNMKSKGTGIAVESEMYGHTFSANSTLNTSGVPLDSSSMADFENMDIQNYFLNGKNPGFAIDGAITYHLEPKLSFTFALNNVGFIRWKDKVKNYNLEGGTEFTGVDIAKAIMGDSVSGEQYLDSLKNAFRYSETSENYTTWLIPQIYLTTRYKLTNSTEASAALFFERYKAIRPALTLAVSQEVGRVLNIVGTYSIQYGKFNNVGAGLMIKPGPCQWYFVGDNFLALANPLTAKNFNFRFGMNLVFGRIKKEDKQPYSAKSK